jgi:hypothetical protein
MQSHTRQKKKVGLKHKAASYRVVILVWYIKDPGRHHVQRRL